MTAENATQTGGIVRLDLPPGLGRAQLGLFADTVEAYEAVRALAIHNGLTVERRRWYDRETGEPHSACSWMEDGMWVTVHAPHGHRAEERS